MARSEASTYSAILAVENGTVSTGVNSLVAVTLEDIIKANFAEDMKETTAATAAKILALFYGTVFVLMMVAVERYTDTLIRLSLTMGRTIGGPMLAAFTLGMFCPCVNAKGVLMGIITGLGTGIVMEALRISDSELNEGKPKSYESCSDRYFDVAGEIFIDPVEKTKTNNSHLFPLYRLPYLWTGPIGFIVALFIGLIVSIPGLGSRPEVDEKLLSPIVVCLKNFCKSEPKVIEEEDKPQPYPRSSYISGAGTIGGASTIGGTSTIGGVSIDHLSESSYYSDMIGES